MTVGAPDSMAPRVVPAPADVVRETIAACALAEDRAASPGIPERQGAIRLRPHQVEAAVRVGRLIAERGGALLADEVGLGKTYVALALARNAREPVIVSPAALMSMWRGALERVRRRATLVSFERLSRVGRQRSAGPSTDPDLVIVDEAHHVRNPTTRRYAALADLCARSRVLLLSATPLHNSRRDLASQLALFLGSAAWSMSDAELARFVVRRTRADVRLEQSPPPTVAAPVWIELPAADDCLELLLSLPPPVPPADGGDGGALLAYSLVRRWASSRAALRATLRRRLARAVALRAALDAGCYPSKAEIMAWSYADGAVQLAFPELVTSGRVSSVHGGEEVDALRAAVQAHDAAVRALLDTLDRTDDPDVDRADAIRDLRARHRGERVIAFAEAAETVEAMFRHLRGDAGVAMLRARGAAVSGGVLTRREALARFAPIAQGAREPHPSQRIDLLLTTDLLSEGVNLQDASVVVHLDLPWNPARLEQRVGRVSRLGSPHARVAVYAVRPPAASERLLAVERRLRAKLSAAGRALGVVGTILPGLDGASTIERGAAEEWTRVHTLLRGWRTLRHATACVPDERLLVAAVRSPMCGFIAALVEHGHPLLLASVEHGDPSTAPRTVAAAIDLACGPDVAIERGALARVTAMIDGWLSRRAATQLSGVDVGAVARARRRVLARISRVSARAPRHVRAVVSSLAVEARRAALMPLGEGGERVLAELADAPLADQAWLRAVAAFGELHARPESGAGDADRRQTPGLVALLLLVPADAASPR